MADGGLFNAKIQLNLVNCDSLPPFSETVDFGGLNGTVNFKKQVSTEDASGISVDFAKDGSQYPRLLALRPLSVRFKTKNGETWILSDADNPVWEDLDGSGITRDKLATVLSFKTPKTSAGAFTLGRPQFYFDGLIELLLKEMAPDVSPQGGGQTPQHQGERQSSKQPTSTQTTETNSTLTFFLDNTDPKAIYVDKNKKLTTARATGETAAVKKLYAVTVQFIAAYGPPVPSPAT